MKNKIFTLLLATIFVAGISANAQEYPEKSSMKTYEVHKVVDANVTVDGIADEPFWSTIDYTGVDTVIIGADKINNAADLTVKYKMFWDMNNIYLFVTAMDDALVEGTNHESDNVEVFFNVDSSQHARDGYNNVTASQIRLNVLNNENLLTGGGYATAAGDVTNFEYTTNVTDDGYDLEAIIPWSLFYAGDPALQTTHFDAIGIETMVEFDIQVGDADDATLDNPRESIITWNGRSPDGWKDVDIFGFMVLKDVVSGGGNGGENELSRERTYEAHYVSDAAVTVDGNDDESFWALVDYSEIDTVIIGADKVNNAADYTGHYKMFWDMDNIYLFVSAKDDALIEGTNHESDNVELFFNVDSSQHARDGYNNITASQIRLNVLNNENLLTGGGYATAAGDATNFEYTTKVTDDGYNLEAIIPWALFYAGDDALQPAHFDAIAVGTMLKFDIQVGDADDATLENPRESIFTWNAKSPDAWKDVDVFGYLKLADELVGIPKLELGSEVVVYPTFVKDLLRVKISDASAVKSITLINLLGQTMKTVRTVESMNNIQVADIQRGMYILKVQGVNNAVKTYKIIKN